MNTDFLTDHALKNVWCTPGQDRQYILQPDKVTPRHGALNNFRLVWSNLSLPDSASRWHVYVVGGIHPMIFNLFTRAYSWVSFREACNRRQMYVDIYSNTGVQLPRFDSYYRYTENGALVIAVRINSTIPTDLDFQTLHVRMYSNAYWNSPTSASVTPKIFTQGQRLMSALDKSNLKDAYDTYIQNPGKTFLFVNGLKVSTWDDAKIKVGDSVEFIYDGSVYKSVSLKVKNLNVFASDLDQMRKYILHYSGADSGTIDYLDDIDFYVTRTLPDGSKTSLTYHKNNTSGNAIRMLTHRDYSLPVPYLQQYVTTFELFQAPKAYYDPLEFEIEYHIRHSGYNRPLVFDVNRIHELYKMSDAQVTRAMTGIDSVVANWSANTLERSMYAQLMGYTCDKINKTVVEQAYGYNAVSQLIGNTPVRVVPDSGQLIVNVPYKCQFGCTVYEYDTNGELIDWHHHYVGPLYECKSSDCVYVETIAGLGGDVLEEYYGVTSMTFKPDRSYRVYACKNIGGVVDNNWVDVTGDTSRYTVNANGVFTWVDPSVTGYPMVRSDYRFLAKDLQLAMSNDGLLRFSLSTQQTRNNTTSNWEMQIPLGQMDIILNKRGLIRGIDYFVDFPYVYIVNKSYLKDPLAQAQDVHVRFTGHSRADFSILDEGDFGFVEHGLLSSNSKYDLRDDKVLRILVDGKLHLRDSFTYAEDHSGVGVQDPLNGKPYLIKDILVPTVPQTTSDTYVLRDAAKVIDKAVSDYLTIKLPQPTPSGPTAIVDRHELYSPFCCKILLDLKYNRLIIPQQTTGYTRQQVIEICKGYEYLLAFDPTQSMREQDSRFVTILPHTLSYVVELAPAEYQFMFQVVELYTNGLVTLSDSVRMTT